ncbi:MAG: hypothetical protein H7Y11_01645 [Armatimonadetes bacterium]|nr:hypothetical protein [Anaerolineae bacterium]
MTLYSDATENRLVSIPAQLAADGNYTEALLPFPSLLTNAQGIESVRRVAVWQAELAWLR